MSSVAWWPKPGISPMLMRLRLRRARVLRPCSSARARPILGHRRLRVASAPRHRHGAHPGAALWPRLSGHRGSPPSTRPEPLTLWHTIYFSGITFATGLWGLSPGTHARLLALTEGGRCVYDGGLWWSWRIASDRKAGATWPGPPPQAHTHSVRRGARRTACGPGPWLHHGRHGRPQEARGQRQTDAANAPQASEARQALRVRQPVGRGGLHPRPG